ncbi:MAG: hypothetical protein ACRELT_07270 [Longimicrobiales bacterium]
MMRRAAVIGMSLCVLATGMHAQSMREQCATAAAGTVEFCESLSDAAHTLPARLALAAAGGNPVSGTASTLGMRVPGSPRWSIALRSTIARASLPPIGDDRAITPTLWSVAADLGVGLFDGFNLLPTMGGFGSIDVLASAGLLNAPEDDGFDRSSPLTWAVGTRLGIVRESFTAPGISVSAMYRSLPDIAYGDTTTGPYFENASQSVISVRGTVGKRVLGIGFTGGVGYDRVGSDLRATYTEPGLMLPRRVSVAESDLTFSRTSFFGNVSYTLLILNLGAELGWQESGEAPAGAHRDTHRGGLFGGIAIRLAI